MFIDKSKIKPGMTGESIAKLHQRLVVLGFEIPADELQDDRYGPATEAAVRQFQAAHGLPVVDGRIDEATARGLGLGGYPASIDGVVCQPDGAPLADIAVRLYQHSAGGEKVVAETRSGSDGKFSLRWPSGLRGGLHIRAEGSAEKAVSWKSALSTDAVWVRLSVGGSYRGPTRFSVLSQVLAPGTDAPAFHALGGAGRGVELAAIGEAARVPAPDVSRYVLAHKLAAKTSLDPRVCYAVLAHNVTPETLAVLAATPGDADGLDEVHVDNVLDAALAQRRDELRAGLAAAVADNLIDELDLEAAADQLHALRLAHVAGKPLTWTAPQASSDEHACCAAGSSPDRPGEGGDPAPGATHVARPLRVDDAPLRDMIAAAIADPAAQRQVLEAFAAHQSHTPLRTILDSATGLSPEQRSDVEFTLEAAALLANHLPLVSHVRKLRAARRISRLSDLARLDQEDWASALRKADPEAARIALPAHSGLAAGSAGDRIDHLAGVLARRLENRFPTAALAGRIVKDPRALPLAHARGVQQLLDRAPAFCVRHTHIDHFLRELGSETLPAGTDHVAVVSDLKTLQRAYKLTARFDHARAMLEAGHHSAYSVHAAGPEQFVAQMTAVGAAAEDAQAMFAQAEQMHATALTLMANFNSAFNGATPAAVAPPIDRAAIQALASLPTVQSLFGSADYCACADCRSVHGPAAYFVDLLEFMKSRKTPDNATNAREIVFGRRPDLQFIEMSCDNTNGVVPYVDLVCEVLEDAVGSAPPDTDVKKRQTRGTEDELRANPAFVRDSAYTTLLAAKFPITAPFDLFGAEVRALFGQLGVPRHELMTAFQTSTPTDTDIAGERFGFGANAVSIVTTAAPSNPWTLWNLLATGNNVPDPRRPDDAGSNKTGSNLQIMSFVPILLDRSKLSHRELIQILETRFVNPGKALSIAEAGVAVAGVTGVFATCDSGQQTVTGWTDDLLTRFNRFIRLWRQLGCTIWDLDKVLAAAKIGNGALDAAAIAQLGKLDAVAKRLKLPWDELLTLWGPIDSVDYLNVLDTAEPTVVSVYKRKFRNPTVTQATTSFPDDPSALTGNLDSADVNAGIAAALDLSIDDIKRIRAATGLATVGGTAPPLNVTNLSTIVRYAALARALGLSIAELTLAIAVVGVDPTDSTKFTPALTLQFLTAFDAIPGTGFQLLELNYLLRHDSPVDSKLGLPDATIVTWLDDLRKALVRLGAGASAAAVTDVVTQRIAAMLPLDLAVTQQVVLAKPPGSSQTIADLFTSAAANLTARDGSGAFTTALTRGNFGALYDAYTALDKMRIVLARWRVNPADAVWLVQHSGTAAVTSWMQLHTFPGHFGASTPVTFTTLDTLHRNVVVQQTLASPTGVRLFDFAMAPGMPPGQTGTGTLAVAVTNVAQLGGWADGDINALAGRFSWTAPGQLVADATVPRIRDLMAWPRKLGTDVATTLGFVAATVGSNEARQARQLAKGRFTSDEWLSVAGSIQDRLREQKRAALVGYLLANPQSSRNQKWVTVEDLYGFFLIDPEMSPVATTTRVKQAAASLQLYVQRCFLQLEAINVDSDSLWKQWDWMKRFRLWEANRKIFLYPENWYDPSLRRDTSPYFATLVDELQQTDLTDDVAQDALRGYLHKLADVAHLEVSGIWEEPGAGGSSSILHVVARTRKSPYIYSYRRRESTGAWSAWQPLDPGANANHIMPAIWNKRLFMFWTEFVEKALPAVDDDRRVPPLPADPSTTIARDARKYFEISLSWLERRNDIWLPKRQSQRKQLIGGLLNGVALFKQQVAFRITTPVRSGTTQTNLVMSLYEPTGAGSPELAQWILTSSQDEPVLLNSTKSTFPNTIEDLKYIAPLPSSSVPIGTRPRFNAIDMSYHYNAFGGDNPNVSGVLQLQRPVGSIPLIPVLNTVTMARVIPVRYGDTDQFASPFFISDPQRTFFVQFDSSPGSWKLQTFYHPFVDVFVQQLNQGGLPGLYSRTVQVYPDSLRGMSAAFDFSATYGPATTPTGMFATPFPTETIDYAQSGPYAIYNWELFLHLPLLVAKRLADNQRFDEALRWFHYIFNPTTVFDPLAPGSSTPTAGAVPQRYWNPKVFRDLVFPGDYTAQRIEQVLASINQHNSDLEARVADWRNNPFDPNLVAAARPVAYQKSVVMAYISTLIAWGDQLFRGDTIESINEATQLYLLASQLLGPRPQSLRAIQPKVNQNYHDLAANIDKFSEVMVDIENIVSVPPPATSGTPPTPTPLHTFYFCVPPNDQMLGYWDKVADRLFKIRHGMTIDGVSRPLALFEPPLDPGVLARAAAAGIDIAAAIADASVGVGCYRFQTLWGAAHDLCQDVRGLGSAILSALERQDGEEMARLRATQEVAVTTAVREVKSRQLDEARASKTVLETTRAMAQAKSDYYKSREFMNPAEAQAQDLNTQAQHNEEAANEHDHTLTWMAWLPSVNIGMSGFGGSPHLTAYFGVENLKAYIGALTGVLRGKAGINSRKAGQSTTFASYQRRQDEWTFQGQLADKEIEQIDKQLAAADLRIAIAERELAVQDRQIADATANAELLQTKFTNQELYSWMVSQLASTYFHAYQLAYDLAKRASKAYAFELGVAEPAFIQFGYWDSLHKGLVVGDKLLLDLRRLQAEHLNNNKRELELTKHVSLLQVDPQALIRLRETGKCDFNLTEKLFDRDQPGQFYRRLKSVSVTLPCVTGPYTSVNATLTLLSHSIRTNNNTDAGYDSTVFTNGLPSESARFAYVGSAAQSVALSTGREDAGMFEVNLRDDRYLPFEGTGAVSRWHLELQQQDNQFDLATLSDVVLHTRYTARYGGDPFRDLARVAAVTLPSGTGLLQLLSARTEFPDAYARLFNPTGSGQRLDLALGALHFPFIPASQQITITGVSTVLAFINDKNYDDYAAVAPGQRLTARVGFSPGDGTLPTASLPFVPNADKLPVTASPTMSGPIGPVTIGFVESELAAETTVLVQTETQPDSTVLHRLIRDRIDDILILVTYQIGPKS